jgi:hypothetical protein
MMNMRLPKGCLAAFRQKTNISVQELCDYAAVRKRPRPVRSKHLESTTGISSAIWLFGSAEEIKKALIKAYQNIENMKV